jgi:hypothetical protein
VHASHNFMFFGKYQDRLQSSSSSSSLFVACYYGTSVFATEIRTLFTCNPAPCKFDLHRPQLLWLIFMKLVAMSLKLEHLFHSITNTY